MYETLSGKKVYTKAEGIVRDILDNPNISYKQLAEHYNTTIAYVWYVVSRARAIGVLTPRKKPIGNWYERLKKEMRTVGNQAK